MRLVNESVGAGGFFSEKRCCIPFSVFLPFLSTFALIMMFVHDRTGCSLLALYTYIGIELVVTWLTVR